MNQNRVLSVVIISVILASASVAIVPTIKAEEFHTVAGYLYIDGEIKDGVTVMLSFSSNDYDDITQDGGKYLINFVGHEGETGTFILSISGTIEDNTTYIVPGEESWEIIDLHVAKTGGDDDDDDDDEPPVKPPVEPYVPSGGGNEPPIADASESQTFGYVLEPIDFDGSKSDDPDGTIDLYEWDFENDGIYDYNSTSSTETHIFNEVGTYSVKLRVTDNEGSTDTDTIEVIISKPNVPPTKPTIEGISEGAKDTDYNYTFQSTDLDNDTIQYLINWGDGEVTETEFTPNGTSSMQNHSWMSAGKYTLNVYAFDNETVSATNQTTILIDAHLVGGIGYLIDNDGDGTYDSFHNDTSGQETDVEKQDDGTYLLDDDGDDSWDWVYDIETDTLSEYVEPTPESDNTALIVLAIIVILFLIILGYLVKRSNDKKKAQKKAAEKKSQSKKKNTGKKSKK